MEESVLQEPERTARGARSNLTSRELQVVELVEQGLKNRDIGAQLGIRPGTVKIHLKHIFEKTGIRGRYGLALSGLAGKGPAVVARRLEAEPGACTPQHFPSSHYCIDRISPPARPLHTGNEEDTLCKITVS